MTNWQPLIEELWSGEKGICFFVHAGKFFWVVDDKFNFSLDAEKEYRAYLEKGHISQGQYDLACMSFRDGVVRLTADNFLSYLNAEGRRLVSRYELKSIFEEGLEFSEGLHESIEQHYLFGTKLTEREFAIANAASSRLPLFYVNFDRKIYIHMDYGRGHEDLAYSDWFAKCQDFCHLVPDKEKYWISRGVDRWKYRFLQAA